MTGRTETGKTETGKLLMGRTGLRSRGRAKHTAWWRRTPKVKTVPWGLILLALLLAVALPTAADVWLAGVRPRVLLLLHYFVSTVYAVTSLMLLWETCAAWRTADPPGPMAEADALPPCTAVIAAFLPNEQGIILETLAHHLSRVDVPSDRYEVVLAYNSPHDLPIEEELRALADREPRLRLLKVEGSRSKAENVNAALVDATGEIVAVYDADHWPAPDCFRRAWTWLSDGFDMVQGRCVIRNFGECWLTRTVGVEFDCTYVISHQGRAALSGAGIFGGSNGYWRREALRETPLDPSMLTEDIDASVRALLAGRRLAHDRSIVSEEQAPDRLRFWLFQRKRWSQGWLEVALRHLRAILATPHLRPGQKVLWIYLLAWGQIFPVLSVQVLPLVLTAWLLGWSIHWFGNTYFLVTSIVTLASGPFLLLAAYLRGAPSARPRPALAVWYLLFGTVGLLYTSLKTLVTLVAQISHVVRDRQWVTTPRAAPDPAASPLP